MEVVYPVCAGMDVHNETVMVCLIWRDPQGQRCQEVRTFSTMTRSLEEMGGWLKSRHCPIVALESTGVYWRPIFNLLEGEFEVMLVNPTHLKHVKGRKTDVQDAIWLADLLEHGVLKGSFIPPQQIRDLRDLTWYRRKLVEERSGEVNRVQKVLEEATIKLGTVASDVMGVSGRAILAALLAGELSAEEMADLSKGRMRQKREALKEARVGWFRPHHVLLLTRMLEHIDFLDEAIADCDTAIEEIIRPFEGQVALMDTVPGVDQRAAQDILAEIGADMSVFPPP